MNTPWLTLITTIVALGLLVSGRKLAFICGASLLFLSLLGLWEQSIQTMALIICAVGFSLLIGLPLGVLAGLSNSFEKVMRPVLDTMQTLPAFVYLLPVVLFFGIARVPAVIATVIYAVPPLIRLISHGIRAVPFAPVESARAFGATWRQVLVKVQMPLALPSFLAGASQCIMMSLGMVVIAEIGRAHV